MGRRESSEERERESERVDKVFELTADGRQKFNGGRGAERGWRN